MAMQRPFMSIMIRMAVLSLRASTSLTPVMPQVVLSVIPEVVVGNPVVQSPWVPDNDFGNDDLPTSTAN